MFLASNDNEWSLARQHTVVDECTGNYQECAWLYIPMSVLRPGAQSFGDLPAGKGNSTSFKILMHTFARGVQVAFTTGQGARRKLQCEMVVSDPPVENPQGEREVLGYRYCLLYSKSINQVVPDLHHGIDALGGGAGIEGEGSDSDSDSDDAAALDEAQVPPGPAANLRMAVAPKSLNEIFASVITYNRRMRIASMDPRHTVAQAAARELSKIDRGGLGYASWKSIADEEDWQNTISHALGHNLHGSDCVYQACDSVFSIVCAFNEPKACAEQGMSRMYGLMARGARVPCYVVSHGDAWNIRWPVVSRVYNIPGSVAMKGASGLYQHMLPHQQVSRALSRNHLTILLPELVRKHQDDEARGAGADADGDADMFEAERRDAEVLGLAEVDGEETQILLMSALFDKLSTAPPSHITGVSDPIALRRRMEHKDKAIRFGSSEGSAREVAERKLAATAYHDVQRSVSRTTQLVGSNYGKNNALVARKMTYLARRVALNIYLGIGPDSPRVAPKMRILMEATEADNLRHVPPEIRGWYRFHRPGQSLERLTMLSAYKRKFRGTMQRVFNVNHLHHLCEVVEAFSLDAYRYSPDLHCNFCAISKKGGTGKSNLWYILSKLRVEGTMDKLTYSTAAGFTGTEDESPNMNDDIKCYDEISPSMFAPGEKNANDHESRLKSILSNNEVMVQMTIVDKETGKRTSISTWVQTIMVVLCSTNIDQSQIQHAMRRRFYCAGIPEDPTNRNLLDTMALADLDPVEMKSLGGQARALFHRKQVNFAEVEKLIHCGALPDVSMDLCGVLDTVVFPYFRQNTGFHDPSPSARTRRDAMARQHAIYRALMHCFYAPDYSDPAIGNKRLKFLPAEITPEALVKHLPRRLFVSVEDYCCAMGLLAEEIVNPLEHAVGRALGYLYKRRCNSREQVHEDLFLKNEQTVSNPASATGTSKKMVRDYNYVVWDYPALISDLVVNLPQFMHGFTTNTGAVRRALLNLTERSFSSYPYDKSEIMRDNMPAIEIGEDTSVPKEFFACARSIGHEYKFAVHTDILERSAALDGSPEQFEDATSAIATALKFALNAKYQIPRTMVLGSQADKPDAPFIVRTAPAPDAGVFSMRRSCVMTDEDFQVNPEIEETVPNAREVYGREFTQIECDLDTFALKQHNDRLYVKSDRVSPGFLNVLSTTEATNEIQQAGGRLEPMFAGHPTRLLVEDTYQAWVRENLSSIHQEFQRPARVDEEDLDYDPDEFTIVTSTGVKVRLEDEIPKIFPNPRVFGVDDYRNLDFKLVAHHPLIEDAYLQLMGC